jgi:hypothetical protein
MIAGLVLVALFLGIGLALFSIPTNYYPRGQAKAPPDLRPRSVEAMREILDESDAYLECEDKHGAKSPSPDGANACYERARTYAACMKSLRAATGQPPSKDACPL